MAKAKKEPAKNTESQPAPAKRAGKAKSTATDATAAAPAASSAAAAPAGKAPKAAGAPKTVKKQPAKSKSATATAQAAGSPLIDTNLVAEAAAKMLLSRDVLAQATQPQQGAQESSTFKNLKEQIAKPRPASLSHLLGGVGEKKQSSHFINQQKGHNQTFSAFNKTGVPRRTNG